MWKNFAVVLLLISFIGLAWSLPVFGKICPGDMARLMDGQCPPTPAPPLYEQYEDVFD